MTEDQLVPEHVSPSGGIAPLRYNDLPEPIGFRRMIGPSVILLGASIGSGEFVLWPHLVSHWGFVLWWACMLGLLTQFFVNMEIERYTLATGESAVIGLARAWKPWAWLALLCTMIPWVWPGWAMGGATCMSYLVRSTDSLSFMWGVQPVVYGVTSMILIGLVLSLGPVVYKTMEKLQFVMVVCILTFVVVLFVAVVKADSIFEMAAGTANVGYIPDGIEMPMLLGAIAYAGAGGILNMSQSNYIKDKSYAMGAYIGRITSLVTGSVEAIPDTGFLPRRTEENARRWKAWWRAANWEHFMVFFVLGAVSLIMLSCIAHSTVDGQDIGKGMDFIRQQGVRIGQDFSPLARTGFWLAGVLVLVTTEMGLMDMVARVSADLVRTLWTRGSETWTLRRLYYIFLWAEILLGCGILLSGFDQPLVLLVLGACLNGLVMALYSVLLLWMNNRVLPGWLAMGRLRMIAMVWACTFYGYFAGMLIVDQCPRLYAWFVSITG